MNTTTASRWTQLISGSVLLSIAVSAGCVGLWINVHHGLAIRTEAGIVLGLSDLCKLVLPVVCGVIGWNAQTRVVAAFCVAASVYCAISAFNLGSDQNLAGKQHGADQYAAAKKIVSDLNDRVVDLDAQSRQEAKNKGCGTRCKLINEQASQARSELVTARQALASAKPVEMSGFEKLNARITSAILLALIELLVWLSVPAMTLLSQAVRKTAVAEVVVEPEAPNAEPVVQPVAKKPRKARKTTSEVERMKRIAISSAFDKPVAMTKKGAPDKRRKAYRRRVGDDLVVANDA